MAILYYPAGSKVAQVNAWNPGYEQIYLNVNPNMVFYFDSGSVINSASASNLFITASWAQTASVSLVFITSSFAETASFAFSAGSSTGGGSSLSSSALTTIATSSTNFITASFVNVDQIVNITIGALYSFTCSNVPPAGTASYVSLFVNNTAIATSSLSFPPSWTFIGIVPSFITASKSAVLSLKCLGGPIVAAWGQQY